MPELPTGTVTFLFTDIEKSTRLLGLGPSAMRDALILHHDLLRSAIERNGGVVFETVGDAVYAVFAKPLSALVAAVGGHRALRDADWRGVGPLRVRIAVHSGEIEKRDAQHYVGEPLIRCARLLLLGHGGQTLVSGVTESLCRDALPPGTTLRDLGEHRLKDLVRREHVFQLDHPQLDNTFPPLLSLDARPNNLPSQLTSFVGRARELVEVGDLIRSSRLLTLIGAGGSGKTRLALHAAADALDEFPDGVWFVELASISDPDLVWPTLGAALGIRERAGDVARGVIESLRPSILDHLRTRRVLLVLDNCEHLVEVTAALSSDLLRACAQLRILATSREALGVAGEHVWRVPSLGESVELFVERALAVARSFNATDTGPKIARICDRLDGMPLAIELAASRTRVLSLDEIADRLDDRFRLLIGGSRTATARHQTLRAAVDWSHALLSEAEQVLWRRLSVFAGGFTLEAAETVCGEAPLHRDDVLDLLSSLTDRSLVVTDSVGADTRHRLLETLREYASERLSQSGEADELRTRHMQFFLALAERDAMPSTGSAQRESMLRFESALDNLRLVLRWSSEHDAEVLVRLGIACSRFWMFRGHLSDGVAWRDQVLPHLGEVDAALRARAEHLAALFFAYREDYSRASELQATALRSFRELGDRAGAADAVWALAALAARKGEDLEARALYEQSLALEQDLGRREGIAGARAGLARLANRRRDAPEARSQLEEALRLFREARDEDGAAYVLHELVFLRLEEGDLPGARKLAEESVARFRSTGSTGGLMSALNALGQIVARMGDSDQALALHVEAERIAREHDIRPQIGMALIQRAELALARGEIFGADALNREALAILGEIDSNRYITWSWSIAARLAMKRGQLERAVRILAAMTAAQERIKLVPPAHVRARLTEEANTLRATLGPDRFAACWVEGMDMSREQTTAYALADDSLPA